MERGKMHLRLINAIEPLDQLAAQLAQALPTEAVAVSPLTVEGTRLHKGQLGEDRRSSATCRIIAACAPLPARAPSSAARIMLSTKSPPQAKAAWPSD